ncbi:MAG: DUF4398 domain-containing protein [Deltaproteobacteria bacterium]|nr:DUF4398 domain-containing protein [Deltaproteobacteria bacterium]
MRALLVIVSLLTACGPVAYVSEVTRKASDRVEKARLAEADKYAPYYWTRAKEYLYKARERAAHADYQGANRFGRLAAESADLAEQAAVEAKKDPSKRPLDLKRGPDVAPAKDGPGVAPAKDSE